MKRLGKLSIDDNARIISTSVDKISNRINGLDREKFLAIDNIDNNLLHDIVNANVTILFSINRLVEQLKEKNKE
jgi:hypothetical protein